MKLRRASELGARQQMEPRVPALPKAALGQAEEGKRLIGLDDWMG